MFWVDMCCSLPCWCGRANAKTRESRMFQVFAGSLTISDIDVTKSHVDPMNNAFFRCF